MKKTKKQLVNELRDLLKDEYLVYVFDFDNTALMGVDRNHLELLEDFIRCYQKRYAMDQLEFSVSNDVPISKDELEPISIAVEAYINHLLQKYGWGCRRVLP